MVWYLMVLQVVVVEWDGDLSDVGFGGRMSARTANINVEKIKRAKG